MKTSSPMFDADIRLSAAASIPLDPDYDEVPSIPLPARLRLLVMFLAPLNCSCLSRAIA